MKGRVVAERLWRCPDCGCTYTANVGHCGDRTGCSRPKVVEVFEDEPSIETLALGLDRVQQADGAVDAAYEEKKEAERALARLLGRREEGKDFAFEADFEAKNRIVAEVIRRAKGVTNPTEREGED